MAAPALSVAICAYTEDRFGDLGRAVDSVRAQGGADIQLIVIVDHNDALLERARTTIDATVLPSDGPRGLSGARNTAVAAADADVVAFLDDDARAAPGWAQALLGAYEDPAVLGAGGPVVPDWEGARPPWFPPEFDWVVGCTYRGMPVLDGTVRNMIGANMSVRRDVLLEVGGFRSHLGRLARSAGGNEETDLCIRAAKRFPGGRFRFVRAAWVWHKVHGDRASLRYFLRRCQGEGVSKATMVEDVGSERGLASERAYATRALPRAVLEGALGQRSAGLRQSAAVALGLGATTVGYVRGRALRRGEGRLAGDS